MRVGVGASLDVQATIDRCKTLGVSRVLLNVASLPGYEDRGHPDPWSLRGIKRRLEEGGVEVPSACVWFGKWPTRPWRGRSTNPDILLSRDKRCIGAMLQTIEALGEVGITSVLHYVDLGKPLDASREEACWTGLIEIYGQLISIAEHYGVGIGNHSLHRCLSDELREQAVKSGVRLEDYGTYKAEGWGGPFLVGRPEELRGLVNAVPSPNNGVTLCAGMDFLGGDLLALIREFAGKIHFCQLRDSTALWPATKEVFIGEGRLGPEFPRILRALYDVGYRGIVEPEHLGQPRYPGEDLEAKAVAYVKSLLDELWV